MCHFVPAPKQQSINPTTLVQFMSLTCHVPPWLVPGLRTRRVRRWATSKVPESKKNQRARSRQIVKRDLQYSSILKFFVRSWCTIVHQIRWHRRCKYFSKAICAMIFKPNAWSYKCLRPGLTSMVESSRTKPPTSLEMLVNGFNFVLVNSYQLHQSLYEFMYIYTIYVHIHKCMNLCTYTYTLYTCIFRRTTTSSTAQGGGGSFKNRKRIGEIDCCEWRMSEQKHWPTD